MFIDTQSYKLTSTAESLFGITPFFINVGPAIIGGIQFSLEAPTTSNNVLRVLRAMQLPRAILLEVLINCVSSHYKLYKNIPQNIIIFTNINLFFDEITDNYIREVLVLAKQV